MAKSPTGKGSGAARNRGSGRPRTDRAAQAADRTAEEQVTPPDPVDETDPVDGADPVDESDVDAPTEPTATATPAKDSPAKVTPAKVTAKGTPAKATPAKATANKATTRGGTAKSTSGGGTGSRSATGKAAAKRPAKAGSGKTAPGSRSSRARKPVPVVSKQPKPWGWIAVAVAVAVFAVAAISYAVLQVRDEEQAADGSDIDGLVSETFATANHVSGQVDYQQSPPIGGDHDNYWADCNGTVYDIAIRNENAVHGLEHGAVWITYNPDEVDQDQIDELADLVNGQGYMYMSPYPDLDSPISLQAWGRQLKVDSADDPRIEDFIDTFRLSPTNTPEVGATCDQPTFKADPLPFEPFTGDTTPPSVPAGASTDPAVTESGAATTDPAGTDSGTPPTSAAPTTAATTTP